MIHARGTAPIAKRIVAAKAMARVYHTLRMTTGIEAVLRIFFSRGMQEHADQWCYDKKKHQRCQQCKDPVEQRIVIHRLDYFAGTTAMNFLSDEGTAWCHRQQPEQRPAAA